MIPSHLYRHIYRQYCQLDGSKVLISCRQELFCCFVEEGYLLENNSHQCFDSYNEVVKSDWVVSYCGMQSNNGLDCNSYVQGFAKSINGNVTLFLLISQQNRASNKAMIEY